jgi:hypothetical protein
MTGYEWVPGVGKGIRTLGIDRSARITRIVNEGSGWSCILENRMTGTVLNPGRWKESLRSRRCLYISIVL